MQSFRVFRSGPKTVNVEPAAYLSKQQLSDCALPATVGGPSMIFDF